MPCPSTIAFLPRLPTAWPMQPPSKRWRAPRGGSPPATGLRTGPFPTPSTPSWIEATPPTHREARGGDDGASTSVGKPLPRLWLWLEGIPGAPHTSPRSKVVCPNTRKGGVSNEAQTRGRMGWKVRGSGEGREGNEKVGRAAAVCVSSQQRELEQVHMQTIRADQHLATTPSKDRGWAG